MCIGNCVSKSIIISGGNGCDWSFCGIGIAFGGGLSIIGFIGFTAPLIGIISTFCAWFAIIDSITGVIESLTASVSGFTGCLLLKPILGVINDGSYIVEGNWNSISIVFGPPPPPLPPKFTLTFTLWCWC